MKLPTKTQMQTTAGIALLLGIAYLGMNPATPKISEASEKICSVSQFKDCSIDEQNKIVATLNTDLEEQNKLIVDLSANLEKAKTNKTNIENQKNLVISSRDAKLTK
jgi:hypothetical protein